MAHIFEDRIFELSTSTGTGDIALAGAVTAYRAFSSVLTIGDTLPYMIEAVDSNGKPTGDYEYGLGTYSAASTITRTTVRGSSNAGAAVNFAAGTKFVQLAVCAPASAAAKAEWRAIVGAGAGIGNNTDITQLSALTVFNGAQKRQTVLTGAATRLAIGTGLAVNLLATTTPLRVSFAGGTGNQGYIDRIATLTADVTGFWSGLTANVVNYLFYDRNTTTGVVTGVASTLPYIAQDSNASISVANGQHTYVYDTGQMYVGNGSVATTVDRTAEGECLAGASTIATVTSYRLQGKYRAPLGTAIANGTRMSFNHNIGTSLLKVRHLAQWVAAVHGFPIGEQINLDGGVVVSASLAPAFTPSSDRLTVGAIGASSVLAVLPKSSAGFSTIALTDLNYAPVVERDF